MNCWSLHPATPATDCGHICSIFFLYLSIIFCIFSSYFIFVHYLLYLLVFGTAGRCIQQRLQPIVDDCRDNLFLAHKLLSLLCFMYYWWVILNIAVHISNVALKWKCSKTSAPLNSSFFCGRLLLYKRTPMAYCKRGQTAVSRYYAIHNIGGTLSPKLLGFRA